MHGNGAYLAFDEVKTGATDRLRRRRRGLRRHTRHHLPGQGHGWGTPCGAIGATEDLFGPVVRGEYDMAGTFNGNPLTMAAIEGRAHRGADARRVRPVQLDPQAAGRRLYRGDREERPAGVRHRPGRQGLGDLLREAGDTSIATPSGSTSASRIWPGSSSRTAACSSRPGPSRRPGPPSVWHSEDDVNRYVSNFEEFAAAISR